MGWELGEPVPRPMRVTVPPGHLRPVDAGIEGTQWRRRAGWDGDKSRDVVGRGRHEPVWRRVLSGAEERAYGSRVGVHGDVWKRSLSWISREGSGGSEEWGKLQCVWIEWSEILAAGDVGPDYVSVFDTLMRPTDRPSVLGAV
ncbi:hypothetical protein QJS10_CPB19g01356 [Acorus calamus]|uniref:Uncharacterized protein n=1 Tax=Acorus calamus TaxID=4465 RepID=A0AAV9CH92_ACOCL|nr:hypothetical protein QJS10_CPB19g01356 [Acorus calamus]